MKKGFGLSYRKRWPFTLRKSTFSSFQKQSHPQFLSPILPPLFCQHLLSTRCPAILSREWKSTRLFLVVSCDSQMTFQIQGRTFRPSCLSCPSMATMSLMRRDPTPTIGQMGSPPRAYSLQIILGHIPHSTMTSLPSPNITTAHCSEMSSGR
jgi:hypothetical protein